MLLAAAPQSVNFTSASGNTLLHYALYGAMFSDVLDKPYSGPVELILNHPNFDKKLINKVGVLGMPLTLAIMEAAGDPRQFLTDLIELFIKNGGDVNACLDLRQPSNCAEILRSLHPHGLELGGVIENRQILFPVDQVGLARLSLTQMPHIHPLKSWPLNGASPAFLIASDYSGKFYSYLKKSNANLDQECEGMTPLVYFSIRGQPSNLHGLLAAGANHLKPLGGMVQIKLKGNKVESKSTIQISITPFEICLRLLAKTSSSN